ncbi:hypothetical protein O6H91_18G023000 [Diphasiastrum complanatum]|uniref:Uncharacterized protein n=1 Tax=Diphasiastrum complanatum TaxID=34168 RepID=A0ACC2AZW9_DIPCM|nr:hypothetical protein O6H91_18G023000 [Diphasiastrum complanatum]
MGGDSFRIHGWRSTGASNPRAAEDLERWQRQLERWQTWSDYSMAGKGMIHMSKQPSPSMEQQQHSNSSNENPYLRCLCCPKERSEEQCCCLHKALGGLSSEQRFLVRNSTSLTLFYVRNAWKRECAYRTDFSSFLENRCVASLDQRCSSCVDHTALRSENPSLELDHHCSEAITGVRASLELGHCWPLESAGRWPRAVCVCERERERVRERERNKHHHEDLGLMNVMVILSSYHA